jgi:hypothetical protein
MKGKTMNRLTVVVGVLALFVTASSLNAQGTLFVEGDNVGIGIATPEDRLHVIGDGGRSARFELGTVVIDRDDAVTANIRFRATGGVFGQSYLFQNNPANGLFSIRDETGAVSVLSIFPNGQNATLILRDGRWGLQVASPAHPIHTNTGAVLTAAGVWQNASSRSLKDNIEALSGDEAINALLGLEPVTYNPKAAPSERHVGFIAEEVPDLVATPDRKTLSSMDIVAVLTRAVQQQHQEIVNRDQRISDLESRLTALEAALLGAQANLTP